MLIFLLALLGGLQVFPNIFSSLHTALLGNVVGRDDAATAEIILLLQLNISFLLVLTVGILARETWALVGVWILAAANIAVLVLLGFTPALLTITATAWTGIVISRDIRGLSCQPGDVERIARTNAWGAGIRCAECLSRFDERLPCPAVSNL